VSDLGRSRRSASIIWVTSCHPLSSRAAASGTMVETTARKMAGSGLSGISVHVIAAVASGESLCYHNCH